MSYTSQQVLKYIKKIHKKGFSLDHTVQNHAEWELENIPVADLKIASEDDPYNRVLDLDQDHVDSITKQDILARAIVADENGHIIDGNHRAAKAQALGMSVVPTFVPVVDPDNETYDQHMKRIKTNETTQPSEYVYHASFLPDPQQGLKSVLLQGLRPSETGYAGPGVYFAYKPEDCYYHVSKEEATMFRVKWADLVGKFGKYPENPQGIERDDNEIIVPGAVPANMLEVEYFPGEWWDLKSAYEASKGPVNEAVIDNVKGAGAVPYNADVDYFGLRVKMKPSTFLKLAAPLGQPHSAELEKYIADGGAIGAPFLDIAVPPEWDENDFSKSAQIKGHEGRNRMTAILKLEGDKPVETHLFVKYYRARDLTPPFIEKLNSGLYAEKSTHLIGGPLFDRSVSEASLAQMRDFFNMQEPAKPVKKVEPVNKNISKLDSVSIPPHVKMILWKVQNDRQITPSEYHTLKTWHDRKKIFGEDEVKLEEAFDQPYPITWEEGDFDSQDALAKLPDGHNLSINFNLESGGPEGMDEEWHVEFWRNNSLEVTGEGDAYRIFATVMVAIQEFIKKENPERISFSASKEVESGQNSLSRAKLYDRMVQRYARTWGYKSTRADRGDVVVYELVRLKRKVGEEVDLHTDQSVSDLEQDLENPYSYDAIDHMMQTIASKHGITAKQLHDMFVAKHGQVPDEWINELSENFADGKGPGRAGDSQRHGIPKHATMAELEKAAKASGRKGQLARWQLNMRRGKKKASESMVAEGGWASTATQNTVITPHIIEEAIGILNQFAEEFNAWQAEQGLDVEIKMGKPVGSGTYYQRDLKQDPSREYGDVDVVCYIHSREGVGAAKRTSEYADAVKQFTEGNPKYSTANGSNVIMDTSAGPIQVDLIFTYNEHANWARALAPEYRVKGVISASLLSSLAEVLNMSFGLQGVQVKTRAGRPVSFRQSKDTELHTVSVDPEMWASDMFNYYYQLEKGHKPETTPANLQVHSGLKDEQRLSDIVMSFKALATDLEASGLLGTGALDYIADKTTMMKQIAQVYSKKLDAVINSSKFDKAETPAAVEKASKTKLMLAKYRNEITKLLLN